MTSRIDNSTPNTRSAVHGDRGVDDPSWNFKNIALGAARLECLIHAVGCLNSVFPRWKMSYLKAPVSEGNGFVWSLTRSFWVIDRSRRRRPDNRNGPHHHVIDWVQIASPNGGNNRTLALEPNNRLDLFHAVSKLDVYRIAI